MNKPAQQQELWEKIRQFNFDAPSSAFPFSKKLAKENNWSPLFTRRAIEEYRKFIFLCCISPGGASPSVVVDEVWHLHLTYTDNYWNSFCRQTLQQEIHHHPSKGGATEKLKHTNWYEDTLMLYWVTFGIRPPSDIWPEAAKNTPEFQAPVYDVRFLKKVLAIFALILILLIILVNPYHLPGPSFLLFYAILAITGLITLYITQQHKDARLKVLVMNNLPATYTTGQMARYLYGDHRAYQTALLELLDKGVISAGMDRYTVMQEPPAVLEEKQHPLYYYFRHYLSVGDQFTYKEGFGFMQEELLINPQLEKLHLLSKKIDYPKLIIPIVTLLVGAARFLQGIANDRPVNLLVAEMGIFAVLALLILQAYSYTQAVRGHIKKYWRQRNDNGYGPDVINNFSILGTTAVIGIAGYSVLQETFNLADKQLRLSAGDSSSACGSSAGCSSGCGGGGCGGCGGCGG